MREFEQLFSISINIDNIINRVLAFYLFIIIDVEILLYNFDHHREV